MNPHAILQDIAHRPYPLPAGPWIMTQSWYELLFAHWPFAPEALRPLIPSVLPIDTFEGQAWVGVVPFRMSNVHPRGFPSVPGLSQFVEMNVRTYVTVNGIPGVYFFSLDASNRIAVFLARQFFHLPYFHAAMQCNNIKGTIHYRSHRFHHPPSAADFVGSYRPTGPVFLAQSDSLAYWLTERYCLYTVVRGDQIYRAHIHHLQWPLQPAELEIANNTVALADGVRLPDTTPLLHYARLQDVLVWPLRRVG